jgi:hypothetical protein
MSGVALPQKKEVKYLGVHLDRRLTWAKHIKARRNQFNIKVKKMYWLLGKRSTLSIESKLLLYKAALKPIWTKSDLHLPLSHLSIYQKGTYYMGIKGFNSLPVPIKDLSHNIEQFKSALKSFLNFHLFYTLDKYFNYKKN